MSKITNNSICHIENYMQMQNLNCVLKICFNNDELNIRAKKIKTLHMIETEWGIRICFRPEYSHCVHTLREDKGIIV